MGAPTLGQPLGFPQHQQLQTTTAAGLARTHQPSATENSTFGSYGSPGTTNLSALETLPIYSMQMAPNISSMVTDMIAMAKLIPNVPLKLQQEIIQGEFIDQSELLQVDFQLKYASLEDNDAFEPVHKEDTVLIWPRKNGKQINSPST